MAIKTDGIILDIDGTLWNTTGVVADAWNKAIEDCGFDAAQTTASGLQKEFGKPMHVIADDLWPNLSQEQKKILMKQCCVREQEAIESNTKDITFPAVRDTIKARRLYESSFEYVPQFKLFFNSNHRPRVDDMTVFESERIKMIPFGVHFGKDRRDPYLKNRLQTPESLSGVLNWCIEGLQAIREEGFKEPPAVVQATDEYRRKMDKLLQFLEEKAEVNPAFEITLGELHTAFANWCSASGLMPVSVPKFKELLEERQIFTKRKRPAGSGRAGRMQVYVLGVRLLPETA